MQNTLIGTGVTTSNLGRKKRRIPGVNPSLNLKIFSLIEMLYKAIHKYDDIKE